MKYFAIIILVIFIFESKAQIPKIESNVLLKENSLFYRTFHKEYDFAIAYRMGISGGWKSSNTTNIAIVGWKKNSWKKIILQYEDENPNKFTITTNKLSRWKAENLLLALSKENFWALSNDSLNMSFIKAPLLKENHVRKDTVVIMGNYSRRIRIVDGATYYFEILQADNLRIYRSEEPTIYLSHFPEVKAFLHFIRARDAFNKIFE